MRRKALKLLLVSLVRSKGRNWSPVGFSADPTPGSVQTVDALARELESRSDWLLNRTRLISGVLDMVAPPYWSGIAARVFSDRLRAVMDACDLAAARQLEAAAASHRWSAAMSHAQQDADAALAAAESALQDLAVVRSSTGVATTDYTALLSGFTAVASGPAGSSGAELSLARIRARRRATPVGRGQSESAAGEAGVRDRGERLRPPAGRHHEGRHAVGDRTELGDFVSAFAAMARIDPTASTNAALMSILEAVESRPVGSAGRRRPGPAAAVLGTSSVAGRRRGLVGSAAGYAVGGGTDPGRPGHSRQPGRASVRGT